MPITSPGNDDDTGENHQPTLRKNTAEPVEQTLKQNNPRHGGDTDALETWRLLAGRHQGGGMGLTVTGPGGKLDVSWEPDGAIPPDGRFYPNPDPSAAYPLLELERAGIIRPVEPAITVYGPYGRPTRLMEVTEPYHNPMLRALRMR